MEAAGVEPDSSVSGSSAALVVKKNLILGGAV
jgi:hypothetical protein